MSERLVHFSKTPLVSINSVQQESEPALKPRGLWVSVEGADDSWTQWCHAESFGIERLAVANVIHLAEDARILRLRGELDIDLFTDEFRVDEHRWSGMNWQAVADKWSGIIIAPYVWGRRLSEHTLWYYGWDCASGCIWDADAIASIDVETPPLVEIDEEELPF